MNLTWLGQAGYYIRARSGVSIMIDPYLSDSLRKEGGEHYRRSVEIDERFLSCPLDVLIITHSHADHMDFGTLDVIFQNHEGLSVLAPLNVWETLRGRYGGDHNYILFDAGIEATLGGVLLRSMPAAHSDERAIGVVIDDGEKTLYHTGDTLFRRSIADCVGLRPDAMLVPINGVGNNLNCADAKRFADLIRPRLVFPMHWDMFATMGCDPSGFLAVLSSEDEYTVMIPEHYRETEI